MVWKQIILEGGFPQWVDVPETDFEETKRIIDEGYSKSPNQVLKSRFTGWDKRKALWRR